MIYNISKRELAYERRIVPVKYSNGYRGNYVEHSRKKQSPNSHKQSPKEMVVNQRPRKFCIDCAGICYHGNSNVYSIKNPSFGNCSRL